jgi:hypothetical protein
MTNRIDTTKFQKEILRDVAGVLAEHMRKSHPKTLSTPVDAEITRLLRAQHEYDILAVAEALVECGFTDFNFDHFVITCRDPEIIQEMPARSA